MLMLLIEEGLRLGREGKHEEALISLRNACSVRELCRSIGCI